MKLLFDLEVNVLDKGTTLNEFMSINLNKNVYAFFYAVDFPNLSDEPMIAFRKIVETRQEFDSDGVFLAIKFDVLRDAERQTYFNFNEPTRLRMYKNGICLIDDYSITSHPPSGSESPLWSLWTSQLERISSEVEANYTKVYEQVVTLETKTLQLNTELTQLDTRTSQLETREYQIDSNLTDLVNSVNDIKSNAVTDIRLGPINTEILWNGPGISDFGGGWVITGVSNWNSDAYADHVHQRKMEKFVNGRWVGL